VDGLDVHVDVPGRLARRRLHGCRAAGRNTRIIIERFGSV
jgi:hypothetical protein